MTLSSSHVAYGSRGVFTIDASVIPQYTGTAHWDVDDEQRKPHPVQGLVDRCCSSVLTLFGDAPKRGKTSDPCFICREQGVRSLVASPLGDHKILTMRR